WATVEQRYTPGQLVIGVVTKIAPFGAFARIEDGIEGLIHLSELTPGVDPKTILHEGAQLQLRILRIDAERRRLGLSLRQAEELDQPREANAENTPAEEPTNTTTAPSEPSVPSLEAAPGQPEHGKRGESRRERAEREKENALLSGLPASDEGELTAMAEAFRAAARQRSKEELEDV
ncbi:MAG TPA: S1 RNA-binding domain-containing protein, partial [Ktedonobacteraceae bacterium]|nr:S1 RNA-binding domain-containing protein [Ktedonobacteraceae bacterium]